MEKKQVLSKAGETVTEKGETLDIEVKPSGPFRKIHAWCLRRKLAPVTRHFEIKPQRVINIYRIASRAVLFDLGRLFQSTDNIGAMMDIMSRHAEDIFYIVACAIQNDDREPTKKMLNIVRNEFEMSDLQFVLTIAVGNYNISAFTNSIALIVGIEALNLPASPTATTGV